MPKHPNRAARDRLVTRWSAIQQLRGISQEANTVAEYRDWLRLSKKPNREEFAVECTILHNSPFLRHKCNTAQQVSPVCENATPPDLPSPAQGAREAGNQAADPPTPHFPSRHTSG